MAKGKKGFQQSNKDAEKWTKEEALEVFEQLYELAATSDDILSIADVNLYAKKHFNLPRSSFYYLVKKFNVLDDIKKDINDAIISKINRKGLNGDFNPTMSIWRMKQLGESDPDKVKNINLIDSLKIEIVEDDESEDTDKN